jgi:WD40 repeat protein
MNENKSFLPVCMKNIYISQSYLIGANSFSEISCYKCKHLVLKPTACINCSSLYCQRCVERQCLKCDNRLNDCPFTVIPDLDNLKLFCPLNCDQKINYKELETHLEVCPMSSKVIICSRCHQALNKAETELHLISCGDNVDDLILENDLDEFTIISVEKNKKQDKEKIDVLTNQVVSLANALKKLTEKYSESQKVISELQNEVKLLKSNNSSVTANSNVSLKKEFEVLKCKVDDNNTKLKEFEQKTNKLMRKSNENENAIITLTEEMSKLVESSSNDIRKIKICQMKCNFLGNNYRTHKGHNGSITSIAQIIWDGDDSTFITASRDNTLRLWNTEHIKTFTGHTNNIWSVKQLRWDKNDTTIISGSADSAIKLWDIEKGENIETLLGHTGGIFCLLQINDTIISGSEDKSIKYWNLVDGKFVNTDSLKEHTSTVLCLAQVGNLFASGSRDETIRIWDFHEKRSLNVLVGHTDSVRCIIHLKWDKDQTTILSGSEDNTIRMWNITTGECLKILSEHYSFVTCLVQMIWEKDQTTVISGGYDNMIKIWNIETFECLRTLKGHVGGINCLMQMDWIKDQTTVLSGSDDKTIKLWN